MTRRRGRLEAAVAEVGGLQDGVNLLERRVLDLPRACERVSIHSTNRGVRGEPDAAHRRVRPPSRHVGEVLEDKGTGQHRVVAPELVLHGVHGGGATYRPLLHYNARDLRSTRRERAREGGHEVV